MKQLSMRWLIYYVTLSVMLVLNADVNQKSWALFALPEGGSSMEGVGSLFNLLQFSFTKQVLYISNFVKQHFSSDLFTLSLRSVHGICNHGWYAASIMLDETRCRCPIRIVGKTTGNKCNSYFNLKLCAKLTLFYRYRAFILLKSLSKSQQLSLFLFVPVRFLYIFFSI